MIVIDQLSHRYPRRRKSPAFLALDGLNLSISDGSFCVVIGPNGSGKSTLFKILAGGLQPSMGSATLNGAICGSSAARRAVGVVFQAPALDGILSVRENLTLFGRLHGIGKQDLRQRIAEITAWSQITDRLDIPAGQLSGGQQRQAELAKCLIPAPPILLLDEPTTGLDPTSRRAFHNTLATLQRETGMTVVMTTHIFEEAMDADRVAILKDGRLIA
ncbi:MAG: ABC transporter ATP-binding protein, partial [Rhodospirillaceae bacterium]|nr:ABC transporter ATP-binding protein [Rhodospirillaceae bacterium]